MSGYFDKQGNPISADEWGALFRDREGYQIVACDEVGDVTVSTVWLGIDHGWGEGPPVIFETMIFGGEHDEDQWRYCTEAEALAGHANALRLAAGG